MKLLSTLVCFFLLGSVHGQSLREEALELITQTKASQTQQFLNISGWINKGLLIKNRVNLNQAYERSPDPSEFKSINDTFAVNYEFFMKDPSFKCRRPSYYNYFSRLLNVTPFDQENCQASQQVTLISESTTNSSPLSSREINPERIYQIHYLFAGKGKQMMSRWGHAMFRIILCAPNKAVGPDCLNDYAQHIVVSYRANIEDMNMDYAKGMNGAYASQLFLMNMSEVVDEYTKGEFRDIISLPLKMDRAQIKLFAERLLENYWSYKGRYYFLTNNCATEAMNLLRSAYLENKKVQTASIVHPLGLYEFLVKNNLSDPSLLNDKNEAIRKGYLFQGVSDKIQRSMALFANAENITFEKFALVLSPKERKAYYEGTLNESEDPKKVLANALRLEEQIQISREQLFAKKLGKALFGKDPMPELKDTVMEEKIIAMKNLYKQLLQAAELKPGYGIPLSNEFTPASPEAIKQILEEILSNMNDLKEIALKFFPEEVNEMKGTLENRQWILKTMNDAR